MGDGAALPGAQDAVAVLVSGNGQAVEAQDHAVVDHLDGVLEVEGVAVAIDEVELDDDRCVEGCARQDLEVEVLALRAGVAGGTEPVIVVSARR